LDERDKGDDTPIIKCCMAGHIESLRALINAGADTGLINGISGVGAPLHWAAFTGNLKAVKILVENGADLEIQDAAHQTSLHIAMKMGNYKMTDLLLRLGANLCGPADHKQKNRTL
ncbi:ankyrin, partial [Hypoxylon sp. EC38]